MRSYRILFACGLSVLALGSAPVRAQPPAGAGADMSMPDDLGAPLLDQPAAAIPQGRTLSIETPISAIADDPRGRAILDKDLPGLCERPEYMMFKGMTPAKLATLSRGRITPGDLDRLQGDLVQVKLTTGADGRTHSIFTRSGQAVERASKAVYHRVVLIIASL